MKKIGLALSGGGFRATLYHLGLIRFLRDAGILSSVTHISSVSGGSIFAAHLALNWSRYNGSLNDFDAAATELLDFVRLDVRNRIVRRWPLLLPANWLRLLCFMGSHRKLTRVGLLEYHYERYLYGDKLLSELPTTPQLHILATNLSDGGICSFNRTGAWLQRRQADGSFRFQSIQAGLATVSMAVAASSAFPGFFPPIQLSNVDVGALAGEFPNQTFTDGGVFDNLGVRLFRCLERSWLTEARLSEHDFFDIEAVGAALAAAANSSEEGPLHRLAQVITASAHQPNRLQAAHDSSSELRPLSPNLRVEDCRDLFVSSLWNLMRHYQLYHEPQFAGLKLEDPHAQALLLTSQLEGTILDVSDHVWLNRHLVEAAFRLATGRPCFRHLNSSLDGVLVSDVGKAFDVQSNAPVGGLIRTAMRSTDILMDRVWQLEKETFALTPGFIFAPITALVDPAEDPTALPPEVQRQTANIRTDLDRFSPLEINSLVRHGYCIGRKACRSHPDVFGADLPVNTFWNLMPAPSPPAVSTSSNEPSSTPTPAAEEAQTLPASTPQRINSALPDNRHWMSYIINWTIRIVRKLVPASPPAGVSTSLTESCRAPAQATVEARALQASASRRIFSTLLDYRDWVSWIYVPIMVPLLVLLPYVVVKSYQRSARMSQLVESLAQGSPDLGVMSRLLEGPMKPWVGETAEEVRNLDEPDFQGFEILQDSRIIDMRAWNPDVGAKNDADSFVYGYRRVKVIKRPDYCGNNVFRIGVLATHPRTQIRFPPQEAQPGLRKCVDGTASDEKKARWEVSVDVSRVPSGDIFDVMYEHISPGVFLRRAPTSTSMTFESQVDTAEETRWFLLPSGKEYRSFRILRWETGKAEKVEPVKVVNEYLADDSTILAFKLLLVKAGYTYEVTWYYK